MIFQKKNNQTLNSLKFFIAGVAVISVFFLGVIKDVVFSEGLIQDESPPVGTMEFKIDVNGVERRFILFVPESYTGDEELPLLINYHGFGAEVNNFMERVDFRPEAEEKGFIVAYPKGSLLETRPHWNAGGWTDGSTADDIGFTKALIEFVDNMYHVDLKRVYAAGHSNGGYFTYMLACQMSDSIAAIASMAGPMMIEWFDTCAPTRPVPVMHFHADTDPATSYNGDPYSKSVQEVLDFWVENNQCEDELKNEDVPPSSMTDSGTSVEYYYYDGCKNDANVEHYKHIGGGHEWLGTPDANNKMNKDLDTNLTILNFFNRYDIDGLR